MTFSGLFHVSKNHFSRISHTLIAYFQGPVHIFGEPNPVFTTPDPVSAETDSLGAVSGLTPYRLSVGITSITRITLALPTFQHYHSTRITSISRMECAQVRVSGGMFPHGVCHMRRGEVCTCDTRQGTLRVCAQGMMYTYTTGS